MKFIKDLGMIYPTENSKEKRHYGIFACIDCEKHMRVDTSYAKQSHGGRCRSCAAIKKQTTHGESKTKLFTAWQGMIQRCTNPKSTGYKNYGGRGVTVCYEWLNSYVSFSVWAKKNGYKEGLSLDKDELSKKLGINPPIYSPETCRWATAKEQCAHSRKMSKEELSRHSKKGWEKIQYRFLDVDLMSEIVECYYSTKISIHEICRQTGIARETLSKYIKEAA